MSYTHLTKTELRFVEEYHTFGLKGREIARKLQRGHELIRQIKAGKTAIDIYLGYKENKHVVGNLSNYLKMKLITLMKR